MIRFHKISTILILLFTQCFAFGQDTTKITRIGPTYYSSSGKSKYFFICDGIPVFKKKQIFKFIDTTMIDSMIIHKDKIYNYNNKLIYNAFIEIQTKDSLNLGLKKILKQTDNWIFSHPLADLYINNKKINWNNGYKKLKKTQPDLIYKIDLFDKTSDNKKPERDKIKIEIKNE